MNPPVSRGDCTEGRKLKDDPRYVSDSTVHAYENPFEPYTSVVRHLETYLELDSCADDTKYSKHKID